MQKLLREEIDKINERNTLVIIAGRPVQTSRSPSSKPASHGSLMSPMVVRKPVDSFVAELESAFVVVKHAALFTSTILSKVLASSNIVHMNATAVENGAGKSHVGGVEMDARSPQL